MVNDPLFIKTKQELLSWKRHKKFKGQKIPDDVRNQIKMLLEKYSRPQVTQGLSLSSSTIAFFFNKTARNSVKRHDSKAKQIVGSPNIFHQIPAKLTEHNGPLLSFEIELPGKFILRLFK